MPTRLPVQPLANNRSLVERSPRAALLGQQMIPQLRHALEGRKGGAVSGSAISLQATTLAHLDVRAGADDQETGGQEAVN